MSSNVFKRTKILATIGPATFSQEKVFQLLDAGVNGIRMNFSHGDNESRLEQINWVRTASQRLGKPVAILQDLQGPKIRLGILKDNMLNVKAGDMLVLDSEIAEHDGSFNLPVQYNLAEKMKVGEPLYMFDGKIKTIVREIVSSTAIIRYSLISSFPHLISDFFISTLVHFNPDNLNKSYSIGASAVIVVVSSKVT